MGICTARCTYSGSATIQCGASGWDVGSFEGQCGPKPQDKGRMSADNIINVLSHKLQQCQALCHLDCLHLLCHAEYRYPHALPHVRLEGVTGRTNGRAVWLLMCRLACKHSQAAAF